MLKVIKNIDGKPMTNLHFSVLDPFGHLLFFSGFINQKTFAQRGAKSINAQNFSVGIFRFQIIYTKKRRLDRAGEAGREAKIDDVLAVFQSRQERFTVGFGIDLGSGSKISLSLQIIKLLDGTPCRLFPPASAQRRPREVPT